MFTKIFARGKGDIKSSINYLLGDKDHTGKIRNPKPILLEGMPDAVKLIGDSISRQNKYTAGSINFRENEIPTLAQREMIMKQFEKIFLAGFEKNENYAILWVEHWDKGRLELNFVVPDKELSTGRALSMTRPGEANKQLFRDFDSLYNQVLGYEQVKGNPLKAEFKKIDCIPNKYNNSKFKKEISDVISEKVLNGEIKNRNQLIDFLGGPENFSRIGDTYLSIKNNDGKPIRLKGPLFRADADYGKIVDEYKSKGNKLTEEQYSAVRERVLSQQKFRKSQNQKLLSTKTRRSKFIKPKSFSTKYDDLEVKSLDKKHHTKADASHHLSNIRINEIHKETPIKTEQPKSINEVLTKDVQKISVDEHYKKLSVSKNILDIRNMLKEKPSNNTSQNISSNQKSSTSSDEKIPLALDIMNLETELSNLKGKLGTASLKERAAITNKIYEITAKIQELRRKQSEIIKSKFKPI